MEIWWQNYWIVLLFSIQMCKITHKQITLSGAYIFQDHKVIFKHFSRKISHFQGRLKNQALFKTAFKFKHFSRSVGTMLQLLQKWSVRVISGNNYNAHTDPLFKKLRLVKLADLFTLNVLKMYNKFKHACLPSYVENMFENFSRHHEHETRQSLILEEPMVNKASGENCLRYILPSIVNNTNPNIINMVDSYLFEGFVRYLKNYMIVHYVDYCAIPNYYICNHMTP